MLTGTETFQNGNELLDFSALDFWRWSASDLFDNTTRGLLAEFLVAKAIHASESIRRE